MRRPFFIWMCECVEMRMQRIRINHEKHRKEKRPKHHMIIIVFCRKKFVQNKSLTELVNNFQLLSIVDILDFNGHDLTASPTLPGQRIPQHVWGIDCFLLERTYNTHMTIFKSWLKIIIIINNIQKLNMLKFRKLGKDKEWTWKGKRMAYYK